MVAINYSGIISELSRIYGIIVSRHQIKRAMKKFETLGLIDIRIAKFVTQKGTQFLPSTTTYVRLRTA